MNRLTLFRSIHLGIVITVALETSTAYAYVAERWPETAPALILPLLFIALSMVFISRAAVRLILLGRP